MPLRLMRCPTRPAGISLKTRTPVGICSVPTASIDCMWHHHKWWEPPGLLHDCSHEELHRLGKSTWQRARKKWIPLAWASGEHCKTKTAHLGCLMAHFTEAQVMCVKKKKPIGGSTEMWVFRETNLKTTPIGLNSLLLFTGVCGVEE